LGDQLRTLQDTHRSIGDVRGLGLFWAVELVRDRHFKKPFNTRQDKIQGKPMIVDRVAAECMKNGVYVNSWINCLIIAPPLIIKKEEIDQGITAIDTALNAADKQIS
jgi:taurine--2-oxoglutarate transaminase